MVFVELDPQLSFLLKVFYLRSYKSRMSIKNSITSLGNEVDDFLNQNFGFLCQEDKILVTYIFVFKVGLVDK